MKTKIPTLENSQKLREKRRKIVEALLLAALLSCSYLCMDSVFSELFCHMFLLCGYTEDFLNANLNLPFTLSSFAMSLIYYLWYRNIKKREGVFWSGEERERPRLSVRKATALSVLFAFGGAGISALWIAFASGILSELPLIKESFRVMEEAFTEMEEGHYLFGLLYISISGPLVEELLFRGLIFHYLEKGFRSTKAAIILSALAFGIWHGIFIQSVYTFLVGLLLGYLYAKTRELKYPILMHFINNFFGTLPPALDTEQVLLFLDNVCISAVPAVLLIIFMMERRKAVAAREQT